MTDGQMGEFRTTLKHYRKNLGISQAELAALAGVSPSTIGNFETGQFNLSAGVMARVQKALFKLIGDRAAAVGFFVANPLPKNDSLAHVEA